MAAAGREGARDTVDLVKIPAEGANQPGGQTAVRPAER